MRPGVGRAVGRAHPLWVPSPAWAPTRGAPYGRIDGVLDATFPDSPTAPTPRLPCYHSGRSTDGRALRPVKPEGHGGGTDARTGGTRRGTRVPALLPGGVGAVARATGRHPGAHQPVAGSGHR